MSRPFDTESVDADTSLDVSGLRILPAGTRISDRYEIRDMLGVGGSAVVYSAWDHELRSTVAVKVMRTDRLSSNSLRRFRREVAVARKANSPRIVRIFDISQDGGAIYLTMELVPGRSLRKVIDEGPLEIEDVLRVAREILEALSALHALSIVHRDVKPENVLVCDDSSVKLADFGLARPWEERGTAITQTDGIAGTLEYLAPEQALGRHVDARTDLYSLGIVLFELLTGTVPHVRETSMGTLVAHLQERALDVRSLRPDTPRWLASIVARLLEKKPGRRYATAEAVLRDLRERRASIRTREVDVRGFTVFVVALAGVTLAASLAWLRYRNSRFDRLLGNSSAIQAVDRRGHVLWVNRNIALTHAAAARLFPDDATVIVGIDNDEPRNDPARVHTAFVIDSQTGQSLRSFAFPQLAGYFSGMSNTFGAERVIANDLDGDGWDEIVATWCHTPSWPSYTSAYSSRTRQVREVFVASGHHTPAAVVDLDGDGEKDLLFTGVSNRLGWYTGVAAVRSPFRRAGGSEAWLPPSTPDATHVGTDERNLLWYALVPTGGYLARSVHVDERRRTIEIPFIDGRKHVLTFDGFSVDVQSARPITERQRLRRESFAASRAAARSLEGGVPREAVASAQLAVEKARQANDVVLEQWNQRVLARTWIAAGETRAAESLFERLASSSPEIGNIAWDAAVAYHAKGNLDSAIRWYRRGYTRSEPALGRLKWEYLAGIVMARAEQEDWARALADVETFAATVPDETVEVAWCRTFIAWRSGSNVHPVPFSPISDLHRYWQLEFRLASGEALPILRRDVERELRRQSETGALLLSLLAEIDAALGQRDLAAREAHEAQRLMRSRLSRDPILRGHRALIAERAVHLAPPADRSLTGSSR